MLTCFDDLVKEVSLSEKLVYWLTKITYAVGKI